MMGSPTQSLEPAGRVEQGDMFSILRLRNTGGIDCFLSFSWQILVTFREGWKVGFIYVYLFGITDVNEVFESVISSSGTPNSGIVAWGGERRVNTCWPMSKHSPSHCPLSRGGYRCYVIDEEHSITDGLLNLGLGAFINK